MIDKISIYNPFDCLIPPCEEFPDVSFTSLTFPGGEPHVHVPAERITNEHVWVDARLASAEGFLRLMATLHAVQRLHPKWLGLFLPYFPGARQDRYEQGGCFTLDMYMRILATLSRPLDMLVVLDPHSAVLPQMIGDYHAEQNRICMEFHAIDPVDILVSPDQYYGVIRPDKGAEQRSAEMAAHLGVPLYRAEKVRDGLTGKLSGFQCEMLPAEGLFLIADDICDGGGTFNGLVDHIRDVQGMRGQKDFDLFVSHGIFSKGFLELYARFEKIITTDSFPRTETIPPNTPVGRFQQIALFKYANKIMQRAALVESEYGKN